MKISSIILSLVFLVAVMMLAGCIYPYWGEGGGHYRGGHRGGVYRDGGHHGGGDRH